MVSGIFRGTMVRPPPPPDSPERDFLDNFCTVFVNLKLHSRLNRKIRVTRLLVTVRVICLFIKKITAGDGYCPLIAYGASH